MAEIVTLTTPVTVPDIATYRVNSLYLRWVPPSIHIELEGGNGEKLSHNYSSTTATAFMSLMNTKNFSSTSIHKEVLKRLQNDGVIGAGVISGTPD